MRDVISTPDAPTAIGPYSQAIRAGDFLFVSGQIPLDPSTGTLVTGDVRAQARRVIENLQAILQAAGATCGDVVKTTVFLADMADFAAMNQVYSSFFPKDPPARSTVAVKGLALGAQVEIECIAVAGK